MREAIATFLIPCGEIVRCALRCNVFKLTQVCTVTCYNSINVFN